MHQDPMRDEFERTRIKVANWVHAFHGVYLILMGLGLAVFCWLLPGLLVKVLNSDLIEPDRVSPLARAVIENRNLMPLMSAPTFVLGALSLARRRPRWLWVGLGLVALLVPAAILIYSFLATVGLLYQVA